MTSKNADQEQKNVQALNTMLHNAVFDVAGDIPLPKQENHIEHFVENNRSDNVVEAQKFVNALVMVNGGRKLGPKPEVK
jgi:hypothetical protein